MTLLEADGVTKRFAGITAVNDVTLGVERNEIVGLIGPNGAGKTTFFNCLCGMVAPDGGRVTFDGNDLAGLRSTSERGRNRPHVPADRALLRHDAAGASSWLSGPGTAAEACGRT